MRQLWRHALGTLLLAIARRARKLLLPPLTVQSGDQPRWLTNAAFRAAVLQVALQECAQAADPGAFRPFLLQHARQLVSTLERPVRVQAEGNVLTLKR